MKQNSKNGQTGNKIIAITYDFIIFRNLFFTIKTINYKKQALPTLING